MLRGIEVIHGGTSEGCFKAALRLAVSGLSFSTK